MTKNRMIKNKKGITPIISVILLLMMTIAIAGLAYTWLQRMQTTVQLSSENTSAELLAGMKVQLDVQGYKAKCYTGTTNTEMKIYVQNRGTKPASNTRLYVDDSLTNITNVTNITAGSTKAFIFTGNLTCSDWINQSRTIKITSDETVAEKIVEFFCYTGTSC